jgi:hypothetical protein
LISHERISPEDDRSGMYRGMRALASQQGQKAASLDSAPSYVRFAAHSNLTDFMYGALK